MTYSLQTMMLCIILLFFSCQEDSTSSDIPPHLIDIHQQLLKIDTIYHQNTESKFQPEVLQMLENNLAKMDTMDLRGYEFLKARALKLKSVDLYNQGGIEAAFKIYKDVEVLLQNLPSNEFVLIEKAENSNLLGLYYQLILKNYGLAEDYHQKYFKYCKELNVTKEMIIAQINLGGLYKDIQQYDKAEQAYSIADSLWKIVDIEPRDSINYLGYYFGQSNYLRDLGRAQFRLGEIKTAQRYYDKSVKKSHFITGELDKLNQIKVAPYQSANDNGIGLTYLYQEDSLALADSSLYYFKRAKSRLDIFPENYPQKKIELLGKIALGYSLTNDCQSAQNSIDQGMKLLTGELVWSGNKYPNILSSEVNIFARLSYRQAKVWKICGQKSDNVLQLDNSLQQYIYVLSYLEKIRTDYPSQVAMEANGIIFSDYANEAIQVALLLKDLTKEEKYTSIAFELSEKVKSFLLRNVASFELAQINYSGRKKELWEKEQNFKNQIIDLEVKNINDQMYGDSLILIRRLYADFIEELKNADLNSINYSYYLDRFNHEIPSIDYIQNSILKEKEALIEYQWISNKIVAFVISKNEINTIEIKIPEGFYQTIFKYSESIKENTPHFEQSSQELYQIIFKPLLPYLGNVTDLIIIRDKGLNNVVFETLLTKKYMDNWKGEAYLMDNYNMVYTYSLASKVAMDQLQKSKSKPQYEMGVFVAYPDEENDLGNWGCGGNAQLSSMENAMRKFTQSKFDSTELLFPTRASATLFKEKGINCKISHFILHGCFLEENHPLTNFLQFTPNEKEDGRLTIADIYNLQLKNQLAVLSSCKTADGLQRGNEGLQSIARAFYYSGCPTVVAAMDNLEDEPTSILLSYFYQNVRAGDKIHEALNKAKKSYLKEASAKTAHPKYWANIICIGNTDPLF